MWLVEVARGINVNLVFRIASALLVITFISFPHLRLLSSLRPFSDAYSFLDRVAHPLRSVSLYPTW